jgi:hypothetical protein
MALSSFASKRVAFARENGTGNFFRILLSDYLPVARELDSNKLPAPDAQTARAGEWKR